MTWPLPMVTDQPVTPGRADSPSQPSTYSGLVSEVGVFRHIELEVNVACDLDCFGCDRFSDVTHAPNMTVGQVRLFVQESLDLKWRWERIRFLGGEPTLHPQIREIVETVMVYRRFEPKCFLQLLSNGRGKLDQHRHWLIDRGVDPHVEAKELGVNPPWFRNTRIAPVDRDPNVGAVPPCSIFGVQGCGIGLTTGGFFLDGAGAAVARVAGLDIGVQSLKGVTWGAMLAQARVLCRLCGHWNPEPEVVTKQVSETGEVTGAFWADAIGRYNRKRPALRVYGEGRPG